MKTPKPLQITIAGLDLLVLIFAGYLFYLACGWIGELIGRWM